jgi:hypothetical protein
MSELVIVVMMICMSMISSVIGGLVWKLRKKSSSTTSSSSTSTTTSSASSGEWKGAYATYYESYPPCCKKSPNYDPSADKTECTRYSGCEYAGQFAGVSGKLSYDQVKTRNIISFYDATNQSKGACAQKNKECPWWNQNAKNKKLFIRNPATGKELEVEALDTCNDADCGGCCTKNAKLNGGTLIDIEHNTALRFWGGKLKNGKIQWRWS